MWKLIDMGMKVKQQPGLISGDPLRRWQSSLPSPEDTQECLMEQVQRHHGGRG